MLNLSPKSDRFYFKALITIILCSACANKSTAELNLFNSVNAFHESLEINYSIDLKHDDNHVKLSREFIAEVEEVQDENLRNYYIQGIHELYRMSQRQPQNRDILEKLVQHQEAMLDLFKICQYFDWNSLYQSLFWEQNKNSYLVFLVCSTGTSNYQFVPFLYHETNSKAEINPLSLTRFEKGDDGKIKRIESTLGIGRTFPNSDQWFEPVSGELRIWRRLLGGSSPCGTKGVYRLEKNQFILQEFRARFECDEANDDYESIYP